MSLAQQIQRRTSSQDDTEITVAITPPADSILAFSDVVVNGNGGPHSPTTTIGAPPAHRKRISLGPPPIRPLGHSRSTSSSGEGLLSPSSASPMRTTFGFPQANGNGGTPPPLTSPFRSTFPAATNGHTHHHHHGGQARTRTMSSHYPSLPSPLSLPNFDEGSPYPSSALPSSTTLPGMNSRPPELAEPPSPSIPNGAAAAAAAQHKRRHSRMHSRNLSVFFPRPGSLPSTAISEDHDDDDAGGQEIEVPVSSIPEAGSSVHMKGTRPPLTPLGQGFKFGGRPSAASFSEDNHNNGSAGGSPTTSTMNGSGAPPAFSKPARRGHHHKHSLSHNFFSFLEPGSMSSAPHSARKEGGHSGDESDNSSLHTQPTPIPVSPWAPISAFPETAKPTSVASGFPGHTHTHGHGHAHGQNGHATAVPGKQLEYSDGIPLKTACIGVAQFLLGAWLWVCGQQIGSLSCTGLGYWVVFDAFGIAVGRVMPAWLAKAPPAFSSSSGYPSSVIAESEAKKQKIRRPYGNGRMETVLLFAQAVYLTFSSVYVCKETVEHLLLSAGGQEGHHHHSGDEHPRDGIDFPIIVIFLTFVSLLSTAFFYENNAQLVNLSGNRLPSFNSFIRSLTAPKRSVSSKSQHEAPPTDPLAIVLTNPFVACPLFISGAILFVGLVLAPTQHRIRIADLILASIIAVLTFNVAYKASVALGTVLLQTAPKRGMPSGKLESFYRAVREIERHPHVTHLPPPHIWQLTPSLTAQAAKSHQQLHPHSQSWTSASFNTDQLVITLDLHVKHELADDDVLALTKWAWERCVNALGGYKEFRDVGEVGGPEVTVGVVRG